MIFAMTPLERRGRMPRPSTSHLDVTTQILDSESVEGVVLWSKLPCLKPPCKGVTRPCRTNQASRCRASPFLLRPRFARRMSDSYVILGNFVTLWEVSSRSRWKATSIFGLSRGMLSAMRCALNSFFERRNGDGRVCGDNVTAPRRTGPCWRRGRSIGPRIGSSGSIRRTTTRNCNRSAKACSEAARSASQSGRSKSPNDWAWSRPFVPVVARGKWVDPRTAFKRKNARWCTRLPSLSISDPSRFSLVPLLAPRPGPTG